MQLVKLLTQIIGKTKHEERERVDTICFRVPFWLWTVLPRTRLHLHTRRTTSVVLLEYEYIHIRIYIYMYILHFPRKGTSLSFALQKVGYADGYIIVIWSYVIVIWSDLIWSSGHTYFKKVSIFENGVGVNVTVVVVEPDTL